jgi:hypothetical protein
LLAKSGQHPDIYDLQSENDLISGLIGIYTILAKRQNDLSKMPYGVHLVLLNLVIGLKIKIVRFDRILKSFNKASYHPTNSLPYFTNHHPITVLEDQLNCSNFPDNMKRVRRLAQAFFCLLLYTYPPAATNMTRTTIIGMSNEVGAGSTATCIFMLSEITVSPLTSVYFISLFMP